MSRGTAVQCFRVVVVELQSVCVHAKTWAFHVRCRQLIENFCILYTAHACAGSQPRGICPPCLMLITRLAIPLPPSEPGRPVRRDLRKAAPSTDAAAPRTRTGDVSTSCNSFMSAPQLRRGEAEWAATAIRAHLPGFNAVALAAFDPGPSNGPPAPTPPPLSMSTAARAERAPLQTRAGTRRPRLSGEAPCPAPAEHTQTCSAMQALRQLAPL